MNGARRNGLRRLAAHIGVLAGRVTNRRRLATSLFPDRMNVRCARHHGTVADTPSRTGREFHSGAPRCCLAKDRPPGLKSMSKPASSSRAPNSIAAATNLVDVAFEPFRRTETVNTNPFAGLRAADEHNWRVFAFFRVGAGQCLR